MPTSIGTASGSWRTRHAFLPPKSLNHRSYTWKRAMKDNFPIRRVDHIRHYVGNARQAAFYYQHVFGFSITGFHGLETGQRHEVDYLLEQNRVKLLFSAPIRPEHPMSAAIAKHGDFVQDIAFEVDDVDWSFTEAVRHGAKPAKEPYSL